MNFWNIHVIKVSKIILGESFTAMQMVSFQQLLLGHYEVVKSATFLKVLANLIKLPKQANLINEPKEKESRN